MCCPLSRKKQWRSGIWRVGKKIARGRRQIELIFGYRATTAAATAADSSTIAMVGGLWKGINKGGRPVRELASRLLRGGDEGELNPLSRRSNRGIYYRLSRCFAFRSGLPSTGYAERWPSGLR